MLNKKALSVLILLFNSLLGFGSREYSMGRVPFNDDWMFFLGDHSKGSSVEMNDSEWIHVDLPHNAHAEPLVVNDQWQGICWYRKSFQVSAKHLKQQAYLEFEGAMNFSQVWINGENVADHQGGFLPFIINITEFLKLGENLIAVKLDNRDNPITGPKPHKKTDFCLYGGLYRNAWIEFKNDVHLTEPNYVNEVAGGGVFIRTPTVSEKKSEIEVRSHVANTSECSKFVCVKNSIWIDGKLIASDQEEIEILAGENSTINQQLFVEKAKLWSPKTPHLYELKTEVFDDGKIIDEQTNRFGIRKIEFIDNQLYVNGKKTFLRGTNRHQEYPYVGYALSDQAQYRDAKQIKDAGFDLIRLSHYPHSPSFMNACDELGIFVLNAILGWQHYSEDKAFNDHCFRSAEQLVRRDRNHACVLAWEVSLNETRMPVPFMQKLHDIVHREIPGENVYTCGWQNDVYDIFVQARQHRILHGYHDEHHRPYLVSEYGDWEYYSNNGGLNQHKLDRTTRKEKSSRQLRSYGEARLLQQVSNVVEAHTDNVQTNAFADAYWVMYDYNSGCHNEQCCSGLADIFRIPKFAFDFYRSQKDPGIEHVLKIASYWTESSPLNVKVFSNCEEVELLINGELIDRKQGCKITNNVGTVYQPYHFEMKEFKAGALKAIGYMSGTKVVEDIVTTPGQAARLKIWIDDHGIAPTAGTNDVIFVRIAAVDESGTIVPAFSESVKLKIEGDARLENVGTLNAEAGIATAVLRLSDCKQSVIVKAVSDGLPSTEFRFSPQ